MEREIKQVPGIIDVATLGAPRGSTRLKSIPTSCLPTASP